MHDAGSVVGATTFRRNMSIPPRDHLQDYTRTVLYPYDHNLIFAAIRIWSLVFIKLWFT
jgi:hypothetical protein